MRKDGNCIKFAELTFGMQTQNENRKRDFVCFKSSFICLCNACDSNKYSVFHRKNFYPKIFYPEDNKRFESQLSNVYPVYTHCNSSHFIWCLSAVKTTPGCHLYYTKPLQYKDCTKLLSTGDLSTLFQKNF